MSVTYNPDDLTTWTLEQLCESDEDEDDETFDRKAFERWRRREEVVRKEAEAVARRKAESRKAQRKERRIKAARSREMALRQVSGYQLGFQESC